MKKALLLSLALASGACEDAARVGKDLNTTASSQAQAREDSQNENEKGTIENGLITRKNANGTTSELNFKDGQLHGLSRQFYANGTIWKETPYQHNQLHGTVKVYDREGNLSRSVNYHRGKKHGLYSRYFKSGQAKLEVEYHHGLPLPGHQQRDYRGNPVESPEIKVLEEDKLTEQGLYVYRFQLPEQFANPQYYLLEEQQSWQGNNQLLRQRKLDMKGQEGLLEIRLEQGYGINKEVFIYATYEMDRGLEVASMIPLQVNIVN